MTRISRIILSPAALVLTTLAWAGQAKSQTTTITDVNVYRETTGNPPTFIVEILGTNLLSPETPRVIVFPSAGTPVTVLDTTATAIRVTVSAPQNYAPTEIALSYSHDITKSKETKTTTCNTDEKVKVAFSYVSFKQASKKYSRGVAINFDVIQMSIVNECPLPVLIPLAGIRLTDTPELHPFSLDHVTSIYSNYHQFGGGRAIYFNILQAMATIGSVIEPFFAHGFTQGVSILGGGFTQASATIWKDLSAEQLQNLTSQSYQSTEQVGPNGGSLQKFIFLPRKGQKDTRVQKLFTSGRLKIHMEIIPVVTPGSQPAQ